MLASLIEQVSCSRLDYDLGSGDDDMEIDLTAFGAPMQG